MILKDALVFIIFIKIARCEDRDEALQMRMTSKTKNPLPYFRRIVEEVPEDSTVESHTDDSSNLVAILVNNAKAIFDDVGEFDPNSTTTTTTEQDTTTESTLYQSYSPLTTLLDQNLIEPLLEKDDIEKTLTSELLHLTKRMKSHEKSDRDMEDPDTTKKILDVFRTTSAQKKVTSEEKPDRDNIEEGKIFIEESKNSNDEDEIQPASANSSSSFRSCISCNNVFAENCDFPDNKM